MRKQIGLGGIRHRFQLVAARTMVCAALPLGLAVTILPLLSSQSLAASGQSGPTNILHVLLLSIDGLHEQDFARYIQFNSRSAMATLSHLGITYENATSSKPSDSFPGLLAMVTGGSPRSTGVFYDDSYDRNFFVPGADCTGTKGAEVLYKENLDFDPDKLFSGGVNPANLQKTAVNGTCTEIFPHAFLRVNTIFEVAKQAGLNTAWADDRPAYDIVRGPSGSGVDDLYTPEISSLMVTVSGTEAYDDLKVQAILDEIAGEGVPNGGPALTPVPAIFGMNFQAVNVAQKDANGGYLDADGTPSSLLQEALDHTDQSLGKLMTALDAQMLLSNTVIILSAKHGQSPIDPTLHQIVDNNIIPNIVNSVQAGLVAQATEDDVALLWLTDQSKTAAAVAALNAHKAAAHIKTILSGASLEVFFNDPTKDSRTPDIIVLPQPGVIYANPTATKIAEHGGFSADDTHVALVIANPQLNEGTVFRPVQTTQIAPTILHLLGLNPNDLQAVGIEHTQVLPVPTNSGDGNSQ